MNDDVSANRLDTAIQAITGAPTAAAVAQSLAEHAVTISGADMSWVLERHGGGVDVTASFSGLDGDGTPMPERAAELGSSLDDGALPTEISWRTSVSETATAFAITDREPAMTLVLVGLDGVSFHDHLGLLTEIASATLERIEADHQLRRHAEQIHRLGAQLMALGAATFEQSEAPTPGPPVPTLPATDELTDREREILEIITTGASNAVIADRLTVSVETVKTHVKHILRKLNAANRSELIAEFGPMSASEFTDPSRPPRRAPRPDRR